MGCPSVGSGRVRQSLLLFMALICALLCVDFQILGGDFNYTSFIIKFMFYSNFINLTRLVKKDNKTKSSALVLMTYVKLFKELYVLMINRKFPFGSTQDTGPILGKYSLTFSHLRFLSASLSK